MFLWLVGDARLSSATFRGCGWWHWELVIYYIAGACAGLYVFLMVWWLGGAWLLADLGCSASGGPGQSVGLDTFMLESGHVPSCVGKDRHVGRPSPRVAGWGTLLSW